MRKLALCVGVVLLVLPAPGMAEEDPIDTTKEFLGYTWGVGLAMARDFEEGRVETAELVNNLVRVNDEDRARGATMLEMHKLFFGGGIRKFRNSVALYNRALANQANSAAGEQIAAALRSGTPEDLTKARTALDGLGLSDAAVTALVDEQPEWGFGMFFAVQPSDSNVIDSLAVGPMFGWRGSKEDAHGYGIGLGLVLDSEAKVLGEGIQDNQALPTGETAVRFKTEDRLGVVLLLAFGLK